MPSLAHSSRPILLGLCTGTVSGNNDVPQSFQVMRIGDRFAIRPWRWVSSAVFSTRLHTDHLLRFRRRTRHEARRRSNATDLRRCTMPSTVRTPVRDRPFRHNEPSSPSSYIHTLHTIVHGCHRIGPPYAAATSLRNASLTRADSDRHDPVSTICNARRGSP